MIETLSGLVALMKSYAATAFMQKNWHKMTIQKTKFIWAEIFLSSTLFLTKVSTQIIPCLQEVCEIVPRLMYRFHGLTRMGCTMPQTPSSFFIPNIPKSGCPVFRKVRNTHHPISWLYVMKAGSFSLA